jgi:hypothetical protein
VSDLDVALVALLIFVAGVAWLGFHPTFGAPPEPPRPREDDAFDFPQMVIAGDPGRIDTELIRKSWMDQYRGGAGGTIVLERPMTVTRIDLSHTSRR